MSKYISHDRVVAESYMQMKRRQHGLKTGEYVRFPDAVAGPFIIKSSILAKAEANKPETVALIRADGERQLAAMRSASETTKALQDKDVAKFEVGKEYGLADFSDKEAEQIFGKELMRAMSNPKMGPVGNSKYRVTAIDEATGHITVEPATEQES